MKPTRDAEPMALFGARLREMRRANHMTQQTVADQLCIDRTTYSKYESGRVSPDHQGLMTLATLFDVTVDQLLGREDAASLAHDPNEELSDQEKLLLQMFRQLSAEEQNTLVTQAQIHFRNRKK